MAFDTRLHLQVTISPTDTGLARLEAWWPATRCSPLPCPVSIERWSDGGWRAAGMRGSWRTPSDAARAYLRTHLGEQGSNVVEVAS